MPYTGRLETRPILDVIQIIAYSQQSGILTVKGPGKKGLLIFQSGNVVCAYSPTALPLLVKAAKESDELVRRTYRRIQVLAALRELFDLGEGDYRFVKRTEPVIELEGLDIRSFYDGGALDTGDLLLVLAKAMDEDMELVPIPDTHEPASEHPHQRKHTRYGPVVIKGTLRAPQKTFEGYLTNLSEGGAFFHAEELPENDLETELDFELPGDLGACRGTVKVVWLRSEGPETKRGAGLSFHELPEESRARLSTYLERFEALAADVDFEA
jgi:uncharacterized protein (TIGR02266 family)